MKWLYAILLVSFLLAPLHAQDNGLSTSSGEKETYFRENALHLDNGFLRGPVAIRGNTSYPVGNSEFKALIGVSEPALGEYNRYVSSKRMSVIMTVAGLVSLVAIPERANLVVFSGFMFAQVGFTVNAYSHLGKTIWEYNAHIFSLKM